ncbi:MAG: PP2C family protein-serine/threonine phosphatase [Actinomycetes bacterium]
MSLTVRYAAGSDVGLRRDGNEDSGYAGPRLLAVADGMGGAAAGEVASSVTIARLAELDDDVPGPDLLAALREKAEAANDELQEIIAGNRALEGMGTTLTALLWDGGRLGLAHVGDSRAYLYRDGELSRITRDHTYVQDLVDEGRIAPDEASTHPQRSLLTRALDGRSEPELDLSLREVRVGDRYLLCSDGLSGVVSEETLQETLAEPSPQAVVDRLIDLALRGGAPDNVTCVIADLVDGSLADGSPAVVGAAATRETVRQRADSAATRAAIVTRADTHEGSDAPKADTLRSRWRWTRIAIVLGVVAVILAGAAIGGWAYVRSQYYVGAQDGQVVIFRGVSGSVAGVSLHRVASRSGLTVDLLPDPDQERVRDGITASDKANAQRIVDRLRTSACATTPPAPAPRTTPTRQPAPVVTTSPSPRPTECVPTP